MKFKLFLLTVLIYSSSFGQSLPELRYADKIRIKEAMAISAEFGDKLFQGFNTVPFAIILMTDSTEFLINHPNPSSDFKLLGMDEILKTNIYYRKTLFSPRILATFPAVNGLSCSVVGTPENTNTNSTEWVVFLLHEHFHQYQNADPEYFNSVDDLDLSDGDQTGKWMLNYPFPYDSLPVMGEYELFTKALYKAVTQGDRSNLKKYFAARRKLREILPEADYRYLSFQIWQEGLARYTEYNFLELLELENYSPSKEMMSLPDFISFSEYKSKMYHNVTERVCFYYVGFAEGILLDRINKSWREKYLTDKFYIEHYSEKYD